MRRFFLILFALLALMTILSACGGYDRAQAARVYERYKDLPSYFAVVKATLDHGGYISTYTLEHDYSAEDGHLITVTDPPALAGLKTRVTGDLTEVSFDGAIFAPPDLRGTNVTPVRLLPDVFSAWGKGIPELAHTEKKDGATLIALTFYTVVNGDEFMHVSRFDSESLLPVKSESFFDGKLVLTLIFESVETGQGD